METAILDACVLFRGGMRDFLLWIADAGAFLPAWSNEIHDEWIRNRESAKNLRHQQTATQTGHTRRQMEAAFPGANMPVDQNLLDDILGRCRAKRYKKDAHVIMSAVVAEASTIVTLNLPDFPADILQHYGLRKEKPDAFCARIFPTVTEEFIEGTRKHRKSLKNPPYTAPDFIEHLKRMDFIQTTKRLLPYCDRI